MSEPKRHHETVRLAFTVAGSDQNVNESFQSQIMAGAIDANFSLIIFEALACETVIFKCGILHCMSKLM